MQVYFSRYNSTHVTEKFGDFHRQFAGLLALVSKHPAGPATDRPDGHLNTGWFSWFSAMFKQMLRWLPRFQVATACFSCSPPCL